MNEGEGGDIGTGVAAPTVAEESAGTGEGWVQWDEQTSWSGSEWSL